MKFRIKFNFINNLLTLFMVVLSFGFVAIFGLLWVFVLDVTAGGQGVVKCRNWIDIKPEIRGIVREMLVKEGQWVKEGDVLFSLEDRERELEVEETELRIAESEIAIAKLRNTLILTADKLVGEITEARALIDAAKANYRIVCKGPKKEEISLAKSKILRARKQLKKSSKDYELANAAYEVKVVTRLEVEQALHMMNLAQMDLRMTRDELMLLKNKYDDDQIAAAKADVDCKQAILQKTVARKSELDILRRDLESALKLKVKEEKKLSVLSEHLKLTRIVSPIDGYVLTHDTEHLIGKAVADGEVVLRIGDRKEYIIDCKVSEKDFPLVAVGQTAKVQIKPFPKGEYKLFNAEVIRVGADVKEQGLPNDSGLLDKMSVFLNSAGSLKEGFFPVILKLEQPYDFSIFGDVYQIKPGFSAEVEIITRQERIVKYLLRKVLRIKGKLTPENIHL
jgi:multidrug resistance efflux pump